MVFEFIMLLALITFVISQLLLTRYSTKNLRKDRELNRLREERLFKVFKRVEIVTQQVARTEQLIIEHQIALDKEMDALSTYVSLQRKQFDAIAKSDMLAARRDELIRTKELKLALERIISMSTMSRQEPSTLDQLAISSLTNRIEELETILGK